MDQELVSRIAATAKSDLQLPDEQLPTIERYVKRAISRILVFCGREDFPPPLEDVAAQIVEDMLRADQVAPSENDVASVTRGDTSISYRDKANSLKETVAFVKNYESQLIPFKRMKLPKDCPPMTEADILALTYQDSCWVYRPQKTTLPSGESVFQKGLDGRQVYENIPCALSSPSGGKLGKKEPTASIDTDFLLFVRPEVEIEPGDTVKVIRLGREYLTEAGLADRQPSHNNVPLKLAKAKA